MATDPVCGMRVADDAPLHATWREITYRFCSDLCRNLFAAEPARYLAASATAGSERRRVAYFSMEIAIDPAFPTYCGGLGILAGDTLRSCADLGVPAVGVTLLYREGYFRQRLDADGRQSEEPSPWHPEEKLRLLPAVATLRLGGRDVAVRAWEYRLAGALGGVPVLLLDTDIDGNAAEDRRLTRRLYDGDGRGRLAQEAILGIGGLRILRALGHKSIARYHMNEGHAALLALELLAEAQGTRGTWDFGALRTRCVFTTHTPVPAGHDRFDYGCAADLLGETVDLEVLRMLGGPEELSMTLLGLNVSGYVNGVAKRHGEVSRGMFPDHTIHAITNGVHPVTWAAPPLARLFDRHMPEWRADAFAFRSAFRIPRDELRAAHAEAKRILLERVERATGARLDPAALTIGFARRATPYKRADLVLRDPDRLRAIAKERGPLQLVFAGKAHPRDEGGKELIRKILRLGGRLAGAVPVVYLPEYDMELARILVAGVDLWLNTPRKPLEASGTSGMKAALNGVPSLSVLDGWWLEGHIEGVTGWSIGSREPREGDDAQDAEELYAKLEREILPRFRGPPDSWSDVMRSSIALNGSYFNTQRMVQQYVAEAYAPVSAL